MALLNVSSDIKNKNDKIKYSVKEKDSEKQLSLNETHIQKREPQQINTTEKLYKISGVVFLDKYMNSLYEKDSKGINNIKLSLYDKDNNLIAVTTSKKVFHISGYYEFSNIPQGKYKITVSVPYSMDVSEQCLQYYYGSKINPKNNSVLIIVNDKDIIDTFIGLCIL